MNKRFYTLQQLDTTFQTSPWRDLKHIGIGESEDDDKDAIKYVELEFYKNSFFRNRKLRLIVSEVLSYNDNINEIERQQDQDLK